MSFRKIIVPLNGTSQDELALRLAFMAGTPFKAHIVALYRNPHLAKEPSYFRLLTTDIGAEIVKEVTEGAKAREKLSARLNAIAMAFGATVSDGSRRMDFLTYSCCEVGGPLTDAILESARLADMVVFGPADANENLEMMEALSETLVKSRRPVLLAPQNLPQTFARRIVVGWDGSFSAAHALTAAIPYLSLASVVDITDVRRPSDQPADILAIKTYLSLHGVSCTLHEVDGVYGDVSELLFEAARNQMADLLIVGGFAHSRLRQSILGGVTNHILSRAAIPVFLVH